MWVAVSEMSASSPNDVLLRRPANHHARRGKPHQGLGRDSGASTELVGAHAASSGDRSSNVGIRRNNAAGHLVGRRWSVPAKRWVILSVSAMTAFAVFQQLLQPLVSSGASIAASAGAREGRGAHDNEQRMRNGRRNTAADESQQHRPSFSASNGNRDGEHEHDGLGRDAEALSEVVIIGGYHNKDEEFRENLHVPDGGVGLGLPRDHGPSNGWGQAKTSDGGGGQGGGGNAIPSPRAEALAAAARGGGEDLPAGGGRGGWGHGTTEQGVAPGPAVPAVPASAPPGWRAGAVGAGAGVDGAPKPKARARSVVLGIPTVPRPQGVNYLEQTLQAVLAQVQQEDPNTPSSQRVAMSILVMNVHGPGHSAFYDAWARHEGTPGIDFVTVGEVVDPQGNPIEVGEGDALDAKARAKRKTLPLTKVRKQTRDLVHLLRAAAGRAEHYLFMEDDMVLCEGGAAAIGRMLHKAHSYHPDWIAIRASFGMNGIFIQDRDVLVFADYLERHQKRRPPDHLVVEWFAGETPASRAFKGNRQHLAFRYNVFEHLGSVSTLRGKASPTYPVCFEELTIQTLFEVEAFDVRGCGDEDMSPCNVPASVKMGFPQIQWQDLYGEKTSPRRRTANEGHR